MTDARDDERDVLEAVLREREKQVATLKEQLRLTTKQARDESEERGWQAIKAATYGGCLRVYVMLCFWWAMFFGLPLPTGVLKLHLFPPGIDFMERGR